LAVMAAALEHISEQHATNVVATWSDDRSTLVRKSERAHRKLVDLIARRDGAGAERFWREHMRVAGELLFATNGTVSLIEILD
jgi:DNA-binding GntR family transcriptional regulator